VAFDENVANVWRPVGHLLLEQGAVELDELLGQIVWQHLIGVHQ
jgi:hypothetical protein